MVASKGTVVGVGGGGRELNTGGSAAETKSLTVYEGSATVVVKGRVWDINTADTGVETLVPVE